MTKLSNPANKGRRIERFDVQQYLSKVGQPDKREIINENTLPDTSMAGYLYHTGRNGFDNGDISWIPKTSIPHVSGTHCENTIPRITITNGITYIKPSSISIDDSNNLTTTGNIIGTQVTGSDRAFKNIVGDLENVLDKISALKFYRYTHVDDPAKKERIGVIAQEIQKVFPELVLTINKKGQLGVEYGALGVLAIAGMSELQERLNKAISDLSEDINDSEDSFQSEVDRLRLLLQENQKCQEASDRKVKKLERRVKALETAISPYANLEGTITEDFKSLEEKTTTELKRIDTIERKTEKELNRIYANTKIEPYKSIAVRAGSPKKEMHSPSKSASMTSSLHSEEERKIIPPPVTPKPKKKEKISIEELVQTSQSTPTVEIDSPIQPISPISPVIEVIRTHTVSTVSSAGSILDTNSVNESLQTDDGNVVHINTSPPKKRRSPMKSPIKGLFRGKKR